MEKGRRRGRASKAAADGRDSVPVQRRPLPWLAGRARPVASAGVAFGSLRGVPFRATSAAMALDGMDVVPVPVGALGRGGVRRRARRTT